MLFNFFISTLAVAGTAVLWRNFLNDHPGLKQILKRYLPRALNKALQCGFCFTYWLALAFLLAFDPLASWQLPIQARLNPEIGIAFQFLSSWMALAIAAAVVRFGYVAIQETVHYFVHYINPDPHHHH